MRILMITDVYFPRINGVSTSIQIFREELQQRGHQVTLIAPAYASETDDETDILRIPARTVLFDPEDRMMRGKHILAMLPMLRRQNFDLVHIQTPFIAHHIGVKLARTLGIPCLETYHTFFEEYLFHYVPFVPKSWMRALARYFTRRQCNALDSVIVPSTAMRDVLHRYGVTQPIQIIPTGMELHRFSSCNGAAFRAHYNIPAERPVLVHIGRVAHEKNIGFLLHMLVELRKQVRDVLLMIAGEGPALSSLQRQCAKLKLQDNVLFVGYLSRKDKLLDCYCAGDVFVFASRTETQGLVLLEAMALGVPVVSTSVMGTRDILEPRRGALIAQEKPRQFAETLQRLLENEFLRKRLAREAREYVREWSAPIMAERLQVFYTQLCSRRPSDIPQRCANSKD